MAVVAALGLSPASSLAQEEETNDPFRDFDSFADAIAHSLAPTWRGPRTPWPEPKERPRVSGGRTRSFFHPVAVQVAAGVGLREVEEALHALELAHWWMETNGWPLPIPDGGRGETEEFDLYLVPSAEPETLDPNRPSWTSYDAPVHWRGLDAVQAFGVVETDEVDPLQLTPCVISTYVRAALLSHDPAEAEAWRLATGDYVAYLLTGRFGCSDDGVIAQQRESWRTWIGSAHESGEGGALFLAMLSARADGLTGRFVRDLWSGAAQLTWEGDELRASPDMWQVIYTVMEVGEDPLLRLVEEMGVSRFFAGADGRRAGAPLSLLRDLPDGAAVPVHGRTRFGELPRRFEPNDVELEPQGSAYVLVDTSEAAAGSRLQIWLRGEYGVRWALTAVRLGADGRERGRTRAPVRSTMPRSYIPLELTDDETASVLIVVTNLGARLVDADEPDDQVRSFSLILDAQPSERSSR